MLLQLIGDYNTMEEGSVEDKLSNVLDKVNSGAATADKSIQTAYEQLHVSDFHIFTHTDGYHRSCTYTEIIWPINVWH